MKITYLFCVLSYIFFIYRIYKSKYFVSELILFSVIVAAGIEINGILINPMDLLIPVLCIYYLISRKRLMFSRIQSAYCVYASVCLLSIFANISTYSSVLISLFQVARVFFIPIGAALFYSESNGRDKKVIINSINEYGIWLCLISIISFLEQGTIYDSVQYVWIDGVPWHRAAGVFGESSYLGTITLILFLTGIYQARYSSSRKYRRNSVICSFGAVICNIISYTRVTNIILIVLVLVAIFSMRSVIKKMGIMTIIIGALVLGMISSQFIRMFIVERMMSIVNLFEDFNRVSSGRLSVWQTAISNYLHGSIIFGNGYKNGYFVDNNYLMSLTQMGIVGIMSHMALIIAFFVNARMGYRTWYLNGLIFIIIISSLTCDVLTYYRPMCLLLIVFSLFLGAKNRTEEVVRRQNLSPIKN